MIDVGDNLPSSEEKYEIRNNIWFLHAPDTNGKQRFSHLEFATSIVVSEGELLRLTAFGNDIKGMEAMIQSAAPIGSADEANYFVYVLWIGC